MKKIISLTKVFVKEYYQNLAIFDNKKLNKKSIFFWLIVIVLLGMAYVSYEATQFLVRINQPEMFLNLYFPVLAILLIFQAILACSNVFFFSRDIEKVLHMPIKPLELLISKFNTLMSMLYITEGIFALVPLSMYGMMTSAHYIYFLWMVLVLLIFPILIALTVSTLTLIIMRFAKFVKNKDVFQIIITLILIFAIFLIEYQVIEGVFNIQNDEQALEQVTNISSRMEGVNKTFLIINPSIDILTNPSSFSAVISFFKIIIYNIVALTIFIIVGRITYLKDILRNIVSINKRKNQKINIEENVKSTGITKAYIFKEFKSILKQPAFFMQCVFPTLMLLVTAIMLAVVVMPSVTELMQNEEFNQAIGQMTFNTEIICDILIVLQVLFSISNISLTAISRDGKNATFIKYIPVELYKQFVYKSIPQIALNLLITMVVLGLIWYLAPGINALYMIIIFAIATVINLINSYLMLIVDLRRPNLDWDSEYAVVRKSDNKMFQYALMIINILILLYIATIFKNVEIWGSLVAELLIYAIVFIIIDRCVKKWQKKLFNKII